MILQNNDGENKVFIDDSVYENFEVIPNEKIEGLYRILRKDNNFFSILFHNEDIKILCAHSLLYTANELDCEDNFMKIIKDDEIVSIECVDEDIVITTMKLPMFFFENNMDNKYPKFEVNLSDCIYSMKIYLDDSTYIEIPSFQSHVNIHCTLDYITQLIYYLDEWRPKFIEYLCNDNHFALIINNKENDKINCGIVEYKLGQEGLYLTGGELDNYLVEWNKFFKLVMDGKWEVNFENE